MRIVSSACANRAAAARIANAAAAIVLVCIVFAGCGDSPDRGPAELTVKDAPVPTPPEVLERLRDLGGQYRLDRHGRVWALSFHRCPLEDGDLEILRSLPHIRTMTLRGVSVVGGTLSTEGLKPIESLRELRRLDLSMNHRLSGSLASITSLSNLEFLDLLGTKFGDEAMPAVAMLPRLKTLRLGHLKLTHRGLKALRGSSIERFDYWLRGDQSVALLGGMKKLKIWFIGYGNVPVNRLPEFAGADQLEEITLTCHGDKCPPESIDALRSLRSLRKLEISGPANSDWPILAALDDLSELKALRLINIGDRALRRLPRIEALETLDLNLSSSGSGQSLRELPTLPQLRHLALNPKTTTADGLMSVSGCKHLETLVFQPNRIGGFLHVKSRSRQQSTAGFVAADLRPVLRQTAMRTLRVDELGFGDELMYEVSAAERLQELGVSGLPITDAGLEPLRRLKHLQLLDIAGTEVSFDAAQSLHQTYLPKCKITDNWCCGCMTIEAK
ncbi:MAG: hypothetical protein H8E44_18605 [Planctomycetes bacterium]|nr:hypothetical protein [Planctomycetota bacterium]MBL7039799.1 hypothetical protein [Pirellulaceae bacterium]